MNTLWDFLVGARRFHIFAAIAPGKRIGICRRLKVCSGHGKGNSYKQIGKSSCYCYWHQIDTMASANTISYSEEAEMLLLTSLPRCIWAQRTGK